MTVPMFVLVISIAFGLFAGFGTASAQEAFGSLEARFAQADSLFRATLAQRDSVARRVEQLAAEISNLKSRGELNYFQRRRLEALLRSSQQLSQDLEAIDQRLSEQENRRYQMGGRLLEGYRNAIRAQLKRIEAASPAVRQKLTAELELLRKRQALLQESLRRAGPAIRLVPVRIDTQDTSLEIRRKADLLRDQEDKLRARQLWLRQKAEEIASEVELRQRMREFVDEVTLFDPTEEGIAAEEASRASKVAQNAEAAFLAGRRDVGAISTAPGLFLSPRQWEALSTPGQFSEDELREVLEALEKEQQKLASQADSLGQLAKRFIQKAKAVEAGKDLKPK